MPSLVATLMSAYLLSGPERKARESRRGVAGMGKPGNTNPPYLTS